MSSDKPAKILAAAESLFTKQRYGEVTLDDICKKARVGKGTIYRYFEDKENLYFQTLLSGFDDLINSLKQIPVGDPKESSLFRIAEKHLESVRKRRALLALLHSEELREAKRKRKLWSEMRKRIKAIQNLYAKAIERGVEKGYYRSDTDPELLASFLMGMLRSGGHVWKEKTADLARHAVAVLENGIKNKDED
ncbi:MAG: TetR/AcrR family transcriptional regulator [Candidatus Brocadiia bacterium]